MTTMGNKIRKQRDNLKLSLDDLAEISGTSKSYIWELENRVNAKPSVDKLTQIAAALKVTVEYLLNEDTAPTDDVLMKAFFRKFTTLEPDVQEKIKDIVDLWSKK